VIGRAREAGVGGMLTICCRIAQEYDELLALARAHDDVWCTVGTHPHDAGVEAEKAVSLDKLVELAQADPKIVGIGESGLDYFYKHSTPEDQQESFRKHIKACIVTGLPLVIHARDADDDVIRILKEEGAGQGSRLKGVMHCFSSSPAMGFAALEIGLYISFSGIITFNKSLELQEFCKSVPLDKILVETDAPYLAPEPHRGQINEPALAVHTARKVAELKNMDEKELVTVSKNNFFSLFDKAKERV
jgi:TatD DNase family protein